MNLLCQNDTKIIKLNVFIELYRTIGYSTQMECHRVAVTSINIAARAA